MNSSIIAPSSPHNVQCQTMSSSTILLTWDKPSQPNGELRMYRIQYSNHSNQADVSTPSTSDSISGLRPFTWYKFRVQAATGRNSELLWGNYSSYVICRSGETGILEALIIRARLFIWGEGGGGFSVSNRTTVCDLCFALYQDGHSMIYCCSSFCSAPVVAPRNFTVVPLGSHSILARWQVWKNFSH